MLSDLANAEKIYDESEEPKKSSKLKNLIKRSLLLISTLTGVAIGILVGMCIRYLVRMPRKYILIQNEQQ